MALRVTTATKKDIALSMRFEPKMYSFQASLNHAKQRYHFRPLSEIATDIKRGQSPKPETYKNERTGKYIFLRTADVKKYSLSTEGVVWLDEATFKTQKANRIQKDDLLVSVVGNYLGSTSVIPSNIELGAFNDNSAKVHIIDERYSPYFVACFFNSVFGQQLILSKCTRTGQKILSAGNLKTLEIPFIPGEEVSEMARQGAELSVKSNALIRQARELFYSRIGFDFAMVQRKKYFSVNIKDFADEDLWTPTFSNPLFVDTNRKIREKWKSVKLGEIVKIIKGDEVGSENYIGYIEKRESDVPFIRTSDIVNYEADQFPDFYIPQEIYHELSQGINAGDILFTNDGKIAQVGIVTKEDKFILQSHIRALRLKEEAISKYGLTPEYVFTVLSIQEIGKYQAKKYTVVQSTIPTMSGNLPKIEIPIIDKNSVDEITAIIKEAFRMKAERKKIISLVRRKIDSYFVI